MPSLRPNAHTFGLLARLLVQKKKSKAINFDNGFFLGSIFFASFAPKLKREPLKGFMHIAYIWKRASVCVCLSCCECKIVSSIISRNKKRFTCYITNSSFVLFSVCCCISSDSRVLVLYLLSLPFFAFYVHPPPCRQTSKQIILINLTRPVCPKNIEKRG